MNKPPPPASRVLPPSKVRKNNAPGRANQREDGLSVMGNMKPLHQGYEEEEEEIGDRRAAGSSAAGLRRKTLNSNNFY